MNCRWSSHHICRYSDVCFWLLLRFSDKVHKDFNSKNAIFEKKNYDKCAKLWLPSLVLRRFIIETVIVIGKHGICPELGDTSMKEFELMERYYSGNALGVEEKMMKGMTLVEKMVAELSMGGNSCSDGKAVMVLSE